MRDPREYQDWSVPAAGFTGDTPNEVVERAWADANLRLNTLRRRFKLLSFTEDDLETPGEYGRGYSRSRLWESYADGGAGVCLALHKETAANEVRPQVEELGRSTDGSVVYKNARLFEEIFVDLGEAVRGDLDRIADEKLATHMDALFLTKNTEWQSESEYRFIVECEPEFVYVDVPESLVGVCLGPETPDTALEAIRYFAREKTLAIGKLLWMNNEPLLVGITRD
jgi:hypothetical protein